MYVQIYMFLLNKVRLRVPCVTPKPGPCPEGHIYPHIIVWMLPQSQFSPSYFTLGCCGCWAQWADTTIMCHTYNNNNNNNTISRPPGGGVSLRPKCYICSADTSCNAIAVTFSGVLSHKCGQDIFPRSQFKICQKCVMYPVHLGQKIR